MKNQTKPNQIFFFPVYLFLLIACSSQKKYANDIDRFSLVNRHNIEINSFDSLSSLTVGNGRFAFTVDATGLQTFPEFYENGVSLGTMAEWGWHSFPNNENYSIDESFSYFEVEERQIPYAIQQHSENRNRQASNYFRINPHRLHLGIVGLELINSDNTPVHQQQIKDINQQLNLWEGLISSTFNVNNTKINLQTTCHPQKDLITIKINSEIIKEEQLGIKLRFPYPTGNHTDDGCNWNNPLKHISKISTQSSNSAIFSHQIDTTEYFVQINWTGNAQISEKEMHYFVLKPGRDNTEFYVTVEFSKKNNFKQTSGFEETKKLSAKMWEDYWKSGGAVDFSGTDDPRAQELERRIILSQYLERVQCAGILPPQETGLTFNSWYGKFHLEMHWWHGVHWAYWNKIEFLEKSLDYYTYIFDNAKRKAELQGYEGARWPKMTGPNGKDSPSDVGEFLIWQQPHIIYFSELCYQHKPDKETLEKYADLVFSTADFMADFARYDEKNNRYNLAPPLIPAQERLEKDKTYNPPFELVYWQWGLSVAQEWRQRLDMERNPVWQEVIDGLPPLAQKDGLYLAAEGAPDSYVNENYLSDHPMVLGAFGMLPGMGIDTTTMENTFTQIENSWNWESTWGWDYPMAAMAATRLGKPEKAVELLLKDVQKNTYLINGHNYQDSRLKIYLPGNGALLTAVAMMCAGYDGNSETNPGFPKNWNVKWENLRPLF